MVKDSPTDNNRTDNLAKHSQCFFVVFLFYLAIKHNWNNKPNAKPYDDR